MKHHSAVSTRSPAIDFSSRPNKGIEFGNQSALQNETETPTRLVLASYNIRYAVGSRLIPSGVLRKLGYKFPRPRPQAVARNIATASRAFSQTQLFPRPDIIPFHYTDNGTTRPR